MSERHEYYDLKIQDGATIRIYHLPSLLQYARFEKRSVPDFRPFKNIVAYLEGHIDIQTSVEGLARPIERSFDDEVSSSPKMLLLGTWQTLGNIIEHIPHENKAHMKLAHLLAALKARGPFDEFKYEGELWQDLPLYHASSHGDFEVPTKEIQSLHTRGAHGSRRNNNPENHGGEDAMSEQYTRQCAFLARLIHIPSMSEMCEGYAVLALGGALELDLSPRGLDLNVPGAVMWILYAGEYLLRCEREWNDPRSSRIEVFRASKETFMWPEHKKKGFSRERWDLWRNSFAWVGDMEGVTAETRDMAMKAADEMVRLEKELEPDDGLRMTEGFVRFASSGRR